MCIGGGPSLAQADLERIRIAREQGRARVVVVNDGYLIAPWADVLYFADYRWWKLHTDGVAKSWDWARFTAADQRKAFASFGGQKVTIYGTGMMVSDPSIFMLHSYGSEGISEQQNGLHTGSNGGYQAVNFAVLAGARRILLVAYDMRFIAGKPNGHNGHPWKSSESAYKSYAKKFATMLPQLKKLGVAVANCTPGSAITCFQSMGLEEALCAPSS